MHPNALEHPEALDEAREIDRAGGLRYLEALGEVTTIVESLFDGPGNPAYHGASKKPRDVLYEQPPPQGAVKMFHRQFWGLGNVSVVAAFGQKGDRPGLLSIVAVGLATRDYGALTTDQAVERAMQLARTRSNHL